MVPKKEPALASIIIQYRYKMGAEINSAEGENYEQAGSI